jgi:hypothetical protein
MFLVHNERTKLTATWLNALATALIAAGLFAPFAALFYGLTELRVGLLQRHCGGSCLSGRRHDPTCHRPHNAREIARMTASEIEGLKILVLAMPAIVVAMALFVVWLTRWQDAREDRRRTQTIRPGE